MLRLLKEEKTNQNRNKTNVNKNKRLPTLTPSLSSQTCALQRNPVSLELSFSMKAWVQQGAGGYLEVNHLF